MKTDVIANAEPVIRQALRLAGRTASDVESIPSFSLNFHFRFNSVPNQHLYDQFHQHLSWLRIAKKTFQVHFLSAFVVRQSFSPVENSNSLPKIQRVHVPPAHNPRISRPQLASNSKQTGSSVRSTAETQVNSAEETAGKDLSSSDGASLEDQLDPSLALDDLEVSGNRHSF